MDDDFDADFSAGFEDEATEKPTTTPEPGAEDKTEQATDPAVAEPVATEPAVKPKSAKITEEQFTNLVNEVSGLKAENKRLLDSAFGKIGGLQQLVDQLKASTAAGAQIEVSEEDFAELKEEYPELAALHVKGLNKALSKVRGTGTAVDPAQVEQVVQQQVAAARLEMEQAAELKRLGRKHSDWRDVVKSPEFTSWLATQTEQVRSDYENSWDSDVTIGIFDSFKGSRKAAPAKDKPAVSTRQQRLDAGVNPRGTGGHAPAPTEDDDFLAGFNSG